MTKENLKYNQKLLVLWAADCAQHVLSNFEKEYPRDNRPRKAIEAGRAWVKGKIKFKDVRRAALAAHSAARKAKENNAACFAARAAGHAVATAHVPRHAFGAAYYALKVVATNSANAEIKIIKELNWQYNHLPQNLGRVWQDWQYKHLPKNLQSIMKKVIF